MFGMIMPLCNRIFCCILGGFLSKIRLKSKKKYSVVQLKSFFIVYPCGKQRGYKEKRYKMQQNLTTLPFTKFKIFSNFRNYFFFLSWSEGEPENSYHEEMEKIVQIVWIMRILRIFKLACHITCLQTLALTLKNRRNNILHFWPIKTSLVWLVFFLWK